MSIDKQRTLDLLVSLAGEGAEPLNSGEKQKASSLLANLVEHMSIDKQKAFDLLASLVEEGGTRGWESPVLEAAERLCNEWRAQGIIRHRCASDYYWLSPGDDT